MALDPPGPADVVINRFPEHWEFVTRVCDFETCHGDLHMSNVLIRSPAPLKSPALLIDFEPSHMPWAFDAAYPQILNSEPGRAGCRDLVQKMAERRRAHGLRAGAETELARLSVITLAWFALRQWWIVGPSLDLSWR